MTLTPPHPKTLAHGHACTPPHPVTQAQRCAEDTDSAYRDTRRWTGHPDDSDQAHIAADLATLTAANRLANALTRIIAALPGQPGACDYSASKVSGGGTLAVESKRANPDTDDRPDKETPDRATADLALAARAAQRLRRNVAALTRTTDPRLVTHYAKQGRRDADQLIRITNRWHPRPATQLERRESAGNTPEEGCVSCARHRGTNGPHWSPVYRTVTTDDGNKHRVCSWCRDYAYKAGVLPLPKHLARHADGHRVNIPDRSELVGTGGAFAWQGRKGGGEQQTEVQTILDPRTTPV